jgi:hypothetical protein
MAVEFSLRCVGYADLDMTDPLFETSSLPGVVYEFRPGARGIAWGRTPTSINALGLRGPEVSLTKPAKTWRVGVFGDSFTFGQGVEEKETYARMLEEMLRSCAAETRHMVEVLNFGVPSYNISNIVSSFIEKGVRCHLDVAVLAPIVDDFSFHRDHRADEYGYPVHAGTPLHPGALKNALRHFQLAYFIRDEWLRIVHYGGEEQQAVTDPPSASLLARRTAERALNELRRFQQAANVNGVVPLYAQLGWAESSTIDGVVQEVGLVRVPVKVHLGGYSSGDLAVSRRDGHPSALQHRLIAEALAGAVCDRLRARQ